MRQIYNQITELRAALGPLSGRSLKYCTDACLGRYLEARNWNLDKAKKMIEETLRWRATYKPEEIRWVIQLNFDDMHKLEYIFCDSSTLLYALVDHFLCHSRKSNVGVCLSFYILFSSSLLPSSNIWHNSFLLVSNGLSLTTFCS